MKTGMKKRSQTRNIQTPNVRTALRKVFEQHKKTLAALAKLDKKQKDITSRVK